MFGHFLAPWAVAAGALLAAAPASGQGWQPAKNVDIIVGTSPGGSLDASARVLQRVWQERRVVPVPVNVVNRPGANGALGSAYIVGRIEDPHVLMVVSNPLLTNHLTGSSTHTWREVTPIGMLMNEYIAFGVAAEIGRAHV